MKDKLMSASLARIDAPDDITLFQRTDTLQGANDVAEYGADGLRTDIFSEHQLAAWHEAFNAADPFPHLVLDNLFAPSLLERVAVDFALLKREDWIQYDNANERKAGSRPEVRLGPGAQAYFDLIHRARFTRLLSAISGIDGLVTDPMLRGGGLHEISPGGRFAVHTDFNRHLETRLDNRLVFITYLNHGWQPGWGGALELWNRQACVNQVVPVFGRSILFAHRADSFHGHPVPVAAPDGRSRRSVAAYFYTNGRPDPSSAERVSTRFLHTAPEPAASRKKLAQQVKYVLPPVLVDGLRLIRPIAKPPRPVK